MKRLLGTGTLATLVAASGLFAWSLVRGRQQRGGRTRGAAPDIARWEDEGGNVPDVSIQAGQQGASRAGRPAARRA